MKLKWETMQDSSTIYIDAPVARRTVEIISEKDGYMLRTFIDDCERSRKTYKSLSVAKSTGLRWIEKELKSIIKTIKALL